MSLIREGVLSARRLAGEGRFGPAIAVLETLAQVLRGSRETPNEDGHQLAALVFGAWLELVCVEVVPARAERLLYELSRTDARCPIFERLRTLTRAALDLSRDPPRALRDAEALGSFDDVGLERSRANIRVLAARSLSEEGEEAVVDDVARWVETSGDATAHARLLGWRGRLAYRVGRFDSAAELHLAAARDLEGPVERIIALTNAASALLEAFRPNEARNVVHKARSTLAKRSPHVEARLEWLARAAAYRLDEPLTADLALVAAVDREGLAFMLPLVKLTEAAIAWRAGEKPVGCELATDAAREWRTLRVLEESAGMAEALALACGAKKKPDAIRELADAAAAYRTAGIGLQTLGLMALSGVDLGDAHAVACARLASKVEPAHRHIRMDVLSADEAERAIIR
jgi:eukaryotic-like serine/threonine-protein kinase